MWVDIFLKRRGNVLNNFILQILNNKNYFISIFSIEKLDLLSKGSLNLMTLFEIIFIILWKFFKRHLDSTFEWPQESSKKLKLQ